MIPESFIEELKYASKIEQTIESYVNLKRAGRNLSGLCPFHSEKTPSFTVYPDTQSYYCFGCGSGGDVITFIRNIENLEYVEALKLLAQKNGLVFPESEQDDKSKLRGKILEINRVSARYFHKQLLRENSKHAQKYLLDRGFSIKSIRKFGIGYAPEGWNNLRDYLLSKNFSTEDMLGAAVVVKGRNDSIYDLYRGRIIFPIIDLRGNVIAFGGRLFDGKGPKYINSPDTLVFKKSRNLFALNFAKGTNQDTLILGEGYMDVVAMHQAGFENSVATLGTSLTEEQSRLIAQYAKRVVIAYDSDAAGQNATKRAINLFSDTNVSVDVLILEDAKDPDEYIKKFGAARFSKLLESGESAIEFEVGKLKSKYNIDINDEKIAFLNDFCKLMAGINNRLQRDVYISQMAKEIEVDKDSLMLTVKQIRKKDYYSKNKKESRELAMSISKNTGSQNKTAGKADDIKKITAEEHLIMLLLQHPDSYKTIKDTVSEENFVDEGYKIMYISMVANINNNKPLDLINLSDKLNNDLMAKLSQLVVKSAKIKIYPEQGEDFVKIIMNSSIKDKEQIAEISDNEYEKYIESLKADKK